MAVIRETYLATVSTNDDPERRGRIKVLCAQVMGSEEEECPIWVDPIYDWGWFVVPDPGEIVEVEVSTTSTEDEQLGQFAIDNLDIRWRQNREYGNSESEEESTKRPVPEDFTANNYGKRRGFSTPLGHIILFDDTPSDPKVSISWIDGDGDDAVYAFLTFDKQGVKLASKPHGDDKVQHCLFFNHETGETSIIDSTGNSMCTMPDGIKIVAAADGESKASVQVKSDGTIMAISHKQITCAAPAIQLDPGVPSNAGVLLGSGPAAGIVDSAVKGTTFNTLLSALLTTMSTGLPLTDPAGVMAWCNAVGAAAATMLSSLSTTLSLEVKVK
jgi:hypothetical protein